MSVEDVQILTFQCLGKKKQSPQKSMESMMVLLMILRDTKCSLSLAAARLLDPAVGRIIFFIYKATFNT